MTRTRMSADARRESIVAAAAEAFAATGYRATTTSAIAARVGVSEPVVFQNFGTKSALFAAVVAKAADHVCAVLDHLVAEAAPVRQILATMLDPEHLKRVHSAGSVGAILADASSISDDPVVEAAAQQASRRYVSALTALLDRGVAEKGLRADLDTSAGAWWLLSVLASQRFRQATADDPDAVEAGIAAATLAYLTG